MLVITRFEIEPHEAEQFRVHLEAVRALFADRPGCLEARVGRNVDEPRLWLLGSRWADPGSYRRALGSHEVKLHASTTLGRALQEPSGYEEVEPGGVLNESVPRSVG